MSIAAMTYVPAMGVDVPKKNPPAPTGQAIQVNLKLRPDLAARFSAVAEALAMDMANLARTIIAENLAVYEERAAKAARKPKPPADDA